MIVPRESASCVLQLWLNGGGGGLVIRFIMLTCVFLTTQEIMSIDSTTQRHREPSSMIYLHTPIAADKTSPSLYS